MKYFLMFVISMCSLFALADERFVGAWNWLGDQCRDSTMSSDSARTVAGGGGSGFSVDMIQILISSQNNATFIYSIEGSRTRQEQATYQVSSNNTVVIGNESGRLTAQIINGDLVVHDPENSICNSNEKFIHVFSRMTN